MTLTQAPVSATIVIPTTLRRESVAPVVEAALASVAGSPSGEVILVPNGPMADRRPLEVRSPRLRVIECPVARTPAARNVGLRAAHNEVVLFTDDDCLISAEWVERLARRLGEGEVAIATPLEVRREGPVTTFLDYQRIFHPRPIDGATTYYGLGASFGTRRDLIDVTFDEELASGDDVQFGNRLRDDGFSIAYETEATPPVHLIAEGVESLATRFANYGESNARVYLARDRPEVSIPHPTSLYRSVCRNEITTPRRFEELADPSLRQLFATLEWILVGAVVIGYLSEAGRILDREIIRVDREGLSAGWLEIERRLVSRFPWEGDWSALPVDLDRWLTPRETTGPAMAPDVSDNLMRNATLVVEPGPDPALDRGAELVARRAEEIWAKVNAIWGDLRGRAMPAEIGAVAQRMRESGVSFREGIQTMEAIALGAVRT
ncbi:MAG TPA: glycosyltransferase [Solirubrobacterales bacterium]|jgi:glycosyltransferase involved in cell wall biosynthesis